MCFIIVIGDFNLCSLLYVKACPHCNNKLVATLASIYGQLELQKDSQVGSSYRYCCHDQDLKFVLL